MFDFINDITITKTQWNLKVLIVRLWEVQDRFNPNSIFAKEMVLQDEKGDRIHAYVDKSLLKHIKVNIKVCGLYHMENFLVCKNSQKLSTTKHKLKLTFTQRTKVTEVFDAIFPVNMFNFRPFREIINGEDLNETGLFDVIGEIVSLSQVQTQNINGIPRKFLNVELEDDENNKLSSTFWGEFVDQIVPQLLSSDNQPIVVVLQLIQAHKFQGSYSVRNTWNASKLWINPIDHQSEEFKKRLLSVRDISSIRLTQTLSQPISTSDELDQGIVQVKTIAKLLEIVEEGCHCWIVATIELINLDRGWSYLSCKKCQKTTRKMENIYVCTNIKCNHEDTSALIRYRIKVSVTDGTGTISLIIWDNDAMNLIGKSANELQNNLLENSGSGDDTTYPSDLDNILQRKMMFKLIVKSSNIHNHDEVYSVVKLIDDEELIKKHTPKESEEFIDFEINTTHDLDVDECKESMDDNQIMSPLKTYDKRTRSSNKEKSVIVDDELNGQQSSNKARKVLKKEKNP